MKALIEVVIKVFAAYLVFNSLITHIPLLAMSNVFIGSDPHPYAHVVVAFMVPIIIGIALWLGAPRLSSKVLSAEAADQPEPVVPEAGIVAAGVFLIGVYWFVRAIHSLLLQLGSPVDINYGWFAVIALSMGLILGNRYMAEIFRKLRTAGSDR